MAMRQVVLATCSLNQFSLDFEGNYQRILESIRLSKEKGAKYRLGPELEMCGYSCEDHFHEYDTCRHSIELLSKLLVSHICQDIMCDVGMPLLHEGQLLNCRVIFLNKKILLIRPKISMPLMGNFREARWFTPWKNTFELYKYVVPDIIREITEQDTVPIGPGVIVTRDTSICSEVCQELFDLESAHILAHQQGVDIITNGSASYFELRKLNIRVDLIESATSKGGGVYLYSNLKGCDGQRYYFDGTSLIALNGKVLKMVPQFSLNDVEVITARINLDDIIAYRPTLKSTGGVFGDGKLLPRLYVDYCLSDYNFMYVDIPIVVKYHTPEEQIALGPACWCWDYLRYSKQSGFILPLSGGIDSSSTAVIIANMCELVYEAFTNDNREVQCDLRRILKNPDYVPTSSKEICNKIFTTLYLATRNSSKATLERAKSLSGEIGSNFIVIEIDSTVDSFVNSFSSLTGKEPKFSVYDGSNSENIALQNIQARTRMVYTYLYSQLYLWSQGKSGSYLVLGSANVDECLLGYLTKYDCSSADINPIGGISKMDLRRFIISQCNKYPSLKEIHTSPPTAELEPITDTYTQTDEQDMEFTYEELSEIGLERKCNLSGPVSIFQTLVYKWKHKYSALEVADKVKRFFKLYSINRHKSSVLTPAFHAESYSPDDNRFDLRPLLYNTSWEWQFSTIDKISKTLSLSKDKP